MANKVAKNQMSVSKIVLTFYFSNRLFCSKRFANSRPSASNFESFSRSLEQFFLTVGPNNFGNKIPFTDEKMYAKEQIALGE